MVALLHTPPAAPRPSYRLVPTLFGDWLRVPIRRRAARPAPPPQPAARPAPPPPYTPPRRTDSSAPTSGYRNVYEDRTEGEGVRYRARVAKRVNLPGRFRTEREAARAASAWLVQFYALLPGHFDRARAVRVMLGSGGPRRHNIRYVRRCGRRYMAFVYVLGEAQTVTGDVRKPGLDPAKWGQAGCRTWATRAEARAAAELWLKRFRASFGLYERFAGLWLWR